MVGWLGGDESSWVMEYDGDMIGKWGWGLGKGMERGEGVNDPCLEKLRLRKKKVVICN